MALIYILAGIFHFIKPKIYIKIIPSYLPNPEILVLLSGLAEIVLGIGVMIPVLKTYALYGIILMLISFFSVHFYMIEHKKAASGIPFWVLLLRIPLQFLLIYWAYIYLPL